MSGASCFSPDYTSARARFRGDALALGWELEEWPIDHDGPDGEPLTIDLARTGATHPQKAVLVSSGLHGVEGFFGSAVQAALLEETLGGFHPEPDTAIVLIHGLNPFGMALVRRANEENVDVGCNLAASNAHWKAEPDRDPTLDELLNPHTAPALVDPSLAQAAWHVARKGQAVVTQLATTRQQHAPAGLFYGGEHLCRTGQLLREHLPRLFGQADKVLHVDFSYGLGPNGLAAFCRDIIGPEVYEAVPVELGEVPALHALAVLRRENRAHHYLEAEEKRTVQAKKDLLYAFNPPDREWRDATVALGVALVERAIERLA